MDFIHGFADAMEGPTTVSALLHAATMCYCSVFLVIRNSISFYTIAWVEYINAYLLQASLHSFASLLHFFNMYLKKIISYSTCAQLGFDVCCLFLKPIYFGIISIYLIMHFFKALLFLCAELFIHGINDEQVP